MEYTSVDDALNHLVRLQSTSGLTLSTKSHLQELKLELEFLRTFLSCLDYSNLEDLLKEIEKVSRNAGRRLQSIRSKQIEDIAKDVNNLAPIVKKEIATLKPKIIDAVSEFPPPMLVIEFIDSLVENLISYQSQSSLPAAKELGELETKLRFLRNFLKFADTRCTEREKLKHLFTHAEEVALEAACFSFMCSSDIDKLAHEAARPFMCSSDINKLAQLQQKIKPDRLEIRWVYVGVVQALKPLATETQISDVDLASFIQTLQDHVKEVLRNPPKWMASLKADIEALCEDLTFLSSYVKDPPMGFNENGKWNDLINVSLKDLQGKLGNWSSFDANPLRHYTELSKLKGQLTRIEDVAIKVGCAIFSYFYVDDIQPVKGKIVVDDLVEKIKQIKEEVQVPLFTLPDVNVSRLDDLGFIRSLLRNLTELLDRQAGPITSLKHQVQLIFDNLEPLSVFLTNHEERRHKNEALKTFATDILFVAHRAEYVIDSLLVRDGPVWYHLLCVSDITGEMKRIRREVEGFKEEKISDAKTENSGAEEDRDTPTTVDSKPTDVANELVVGLEDDIVYLRQQLTRGSKALSVIAIVGMPGVGKTTLAKTVYNDPSIISHFDIRVFLHISQKYESRQLLIQILRDITGQNDTLDKRSFSDLSEMLHKLLKWKRFLILMDDVWDVEAWHGLSASVSDDNYGSKILLTTRSDSVAKNIDVGRGELLIHHVQCLTSNKALELLAKKIFQEEHVPLQLETVAMKIAEKAHGLPLVIGMIAGMLAKEKTVEFWEQALENLQHSKNQNASSVIGMSYENLLDCLRPCFLYFGALPPEAEIPTSKLIRLWIAEGFIQQTEGNSLEDVAMDYLMLLIERNLIMVARKSSRGRVKSCYIHDLIQDFCLAKGKLENFYQLMGSYSGVSTPLDGFKCEHRRLFISSFWDDHNTSRVSGPLVRSLVLNGSTSEFSMFACDVSSVSQNFKLVRVLDLACINVGNTFPAGLEKMTLLRYLAIRGEMNDIPSSIGSLQQLETFVTIGLSGEITIPNAIWSLTNLRHLHITDRASFAPPDNRRKFSDKLPNLRTMSTPFLSYGEDSEEIVRRLASLEKLKCIILESWDTFTKKNMFPRLDFLQQLVSLKLFYYGRVRKTCEFNFPWNLRKLTLSRFCLPWDQISIIGELPNLEVLKLLTKAFEGSLWEVRDVQFLTLKLLILDTLDLEEWHFSDKALPCLERLELQKCKKLKKIPFSIGDIPTLKEIEVKWCNQSIEELALNIQNEQEENGNYMFKVIIHKTDDRVATAN
ncbi:putative late blight resistance protein homolog R1A-3 [Solanum stenotomum]|uniref:putative late blight resistance protein homolog R1A-3 n=1 Tax=Solanum stenotomum TaxID=172797 RepID=UPI0020D01D4A|nr:putative late blight resistance protein homolog R1A-3 [Solanum stenotomum]